ncbi:Aste57867_22513 [Aphanomyces stellatus]|uniref:Aste57867_17264 protein n=1 Tax=Aphanomyces stellatus TaxID=120398 RepID=A0A485LLY4_9STRA|nr:hypothetical protein As57867_022443 [Aphanomyces stellatus]KAF0691542.1 hypothetical protein As57867_017205 [Aphanomyces stellatus]VFT94020.1 Aste57867_17264 [Aphanomyces stellatus]VFT99173.1 Aste57867_22513 [Aphanomyces stellatus]
MADAGDMIGSLKDANEAYKKENESMKVQISTLKSELEKLKTQTEIHSSSNFVKLKQERDLTASLQKKVNAQAAEIQKLKDQIAKGCNGSASRSGLKWTRPAAARWAICWLLSP